MTLLSPAPFATFTASTTSGRGRVDHAEQADEGEILLDAVGLRAFGTSRQRPIGDAQHAERVARHVAVLLEHLSAPLLGQGHGLPGLLDVAASVEDDVGRALHEGDEGRVGEARADACSGDPSRRWIVVIRLRSESNGISWTRGSAASSSPRRNPPLAAATTRAPSVGSPTIRQERPPASSLRSSSLASLQSNAPVQQHRGVRDRCAGRTALPSTKNCPVGL